MKIPRAIELIKRLEKDGYSVYSVAENLFEKTDFVNPKVPASDEYYDAENWYTPPPNILAQAVLKGATSEILLRAYYEHNINWTGNTGEGRALDAHNKYLVTVEYLVKEENEMSFPANE